MIFKANCKINLGLDVVRKREDGYHELETVMLPVVGLYDIVGVEPIASGVEFRGIGIEVDCPMEKNLCVRAARLMQERYNIGGVGIVLDKRVPFGAGLGGGSSDATAVILAINEIYNLALDKSMLSALAAELGSDTPFFVYNSPMLCTGRGEIMSPAKVDLSGLWLVVAKPAAISRLIKSSVILGTTHSSLLSFVLHFHDNATIFLCRHSRLRNRHLRPR